MNTKTRFQKRSAFKNLHSQRKLGYATVCPAIAAAVAAVLGVQAQAQQSTIIQDSFVGNGTLGTDNYSNYSAGMAPTGTDLGTNATWQWMGGYFSNDYETTTYGRTGAFIRSATAVGIGLGSYSSSGVLQTSVTADFSVGNATYPVSASGYILAGFSNANLATTSNTAGYYSTNPRAATTYTGLAIMGDGSLQEYVAGTPVADVPWGGNALTNFGQVAGASPATTLTYDLNTATGAITGVSFSISGYGTNTADYSTFATAPGSFSSADLTDNEIGASGGYNNVYAGYGFNDTNNLANYTDYELSTVGAVPEPGTCGAMLSGLGMLLGLQKFRSRKA